MRNREVLRRVLLWGIVAVFLATCAVLAFRGLWWGLLGFTAFPLVGAIILTSRRRNGVGWYLLGVGIAFVILEWSLDTEFAYLGPAWIESLMNAFAGVFWTGLFVVGPIFPSGRAETRLGRIGLGAVTALALGIAVITLISDAPLPSGRPNPFAIPGAWRLEDLQGGSFVAFAVIGGVLLVDLVRRWRAADSVTGLQYRWFIFALSVVVTSVTVTGLLSALVPGTVLFGTAGVVATLSLNLIPISIGVAVTRHGLYQINRIVSRTVTYTTVTAVAVGVYALVVTSATWLMPRLPSVGVAVATLAAAAVFLPALRSVQRAIDRRFDRERYDAEQVVDAFGERLRASIDPTATADDLVHAVERTLQPATAGLWRR